MIIKNFIFILILIYAGYMDYKYRIIPDKVHLMFIALGLIKLNVIQSILGLILIPIPFIIPALINEDSIGGGDIKIVGSIGFFLGLKDGLLVIIISLILAISLHYFILRKDKKEGFPYAPYLAISCILFLI